MIQKFLINDIPTYFIKSVVNVKLITFLKLSLASVKENLNFYVSEVVTCWLWTTQLECKPLLFPLASNVTK